ncbi:MAG: hypothetical protein AMXMBFR36_26630 [Acidobacteriota bacterium]
MAPVVATIVVVLLVAAAIFGLARLVMAPREWSDEEYERRRAAPGSGVLAASMKALGEELGPGGPRAAEERRAFEEGRYDEEQGAGEPPEPGRSIGESGSPGRQVE